MDKLSHANRLAILSILLAGCSVVNTLVVQDYGEVYVDSEFRPLVELFNREASDRGIQDANKPMSITFDLVDDDPDVIGACMIGVYKSKIKIKTNSWRAMTDEEKEMLIFHELGHCVLGRKHCDVKSNGIPISIMYPNILVSGQYRNSRKYLLDELFNEDQRCQSSN